MTRPSSSVLLGLPCVAIGATLVLVAADVVAVDPATIHAPRWVLGVCGGVFALGGLAIIVPPDSPVRVAAAGTIVLGFGLVAGWVALFGDAAQVSGGLPFVPAAVNVALARGLFGLGALLCVGSFAWGTSQLLRGQSKE